MSLKQTFHRFGFNIMLAENLSAEKMLLQMNDGWSFYIYKTLYVRNALSYVRRMKDSLILLTAWLPTIHSVW
jgi:hypothetical protein